MCESMCVGSLRMTFVPAEAPKVVPKQRITARIGLDSFQVGDRVFNCMNGSSGRLHHKEAWTVVRVSTYGNQLLKAQENYVCPGYDCPYVLESETIIEDGKRVVGYVNDPCPAVTSPKTLKFNDLPDWCVFTSNRVDNGERNRMELIKINHNTVLCSYDNWDKTCRYVYMLRSTADESWGIDNNLADCTIIGTIKFG